MDEYQLANEKSTEILSIENGKVVVRSEALRYIKEHSTNNLTRVISFIGPVASGKSTLTSIFLTELSKAARKSAPQITPYIRTAEDRGRGVRAVTGGGHWYKCGNFVVMDYEGTSASDNPPIMSGIVLPDPTRKQGLMQLLKIAYHCSDIIVIVGSYNFATSDFMDDLKKLVETQTEDLKGALKPALLIVSNRSEYDPKFEVTEQFLKRGNSSTLFRYYDEIHCFKLMDWNEEAEEEIDSMKAFEKQIETIKNLVVSILERKQKQRASLFLDYSDSSWCDLLELVVNKQDGKYDWNELLVGFMKETVLKKQATQLLVNLLYECEGDQEKFLMEAAIRLGALSFVIDFKEAGAKQNKQAEISTMYRKGTILDEKVLKDKFKPLFDQLFGCQRCTSRPKNHLGIRCTTRRRNHYNETSHVGDSAGTDHGKGIIKAVKDIFNFGHISTWGEKSGIKVPFEGRCYGENEFQAKFSKLAEEAILLPMEMLRMGVMMIVQGIRKKFKNFPATKQFCCSCFRTIEFQEGTNISCGHIICENCKVIYYKHWNVENWNTLSALLPFCEAPPYLERRMCPICDAMTVSVPIRTTIIHNNTTLYRWPQFLNFGGDKCKLYSAIEDQFNVVNDTDSKCSFQVIIPNDPGRFSIIVNPQIGEIPAHGEVVIEVSFIPRKSGTIRDFLTVDITEHPVTLKTSYLIQLEAKGEFELVDKEIKYEDLELGKEIGSGAQGRVREACIKGTNEFQYVVKSFPFSLNDCVPEDRELMLRELRMISLMNNPYVDKLLGYDLSDSWLKLITRRRLCCLRTALSNGMSMKQRQRAALDMARGLEYLHGLKIAHRDLKPENVLYVAPNANPSAIIADFGISRPTGPGMSRPVGTHPYISPQMMAPSFQRSSYTEKTDIYSYGIILWELYTSKHVSKLTEDEQDRNTKRPKIPGDCPLELKSLIERCWATEEKDRPSAAEIVLDDWFKVNL